MKNLKKGKFYLTHDGSKTGHPGMIYWKSDKNNLYLAFKTDSSDGRHRVKLSKATDNTVKTSYVSSRPFLGKRKDFGSKELENMSFSINDYEILVSISQKEPIESRSISRQDRRKLPRNTKFKK